MMAYLLADSVTKGKEIPLYDNGQMYRDWTYVDDTVNGIVSAIDRPLGYAARKAGWPASLPTATCASRRASIGPSPRS